MDAKQLAWIETALREAPEDWKICYFHHPLYSSASRHGSAVDLRALLEPIFVKHAVNMVFAGHDHVYERLKPQSGIIHVGREPVESCGAAAEATEQTAAFFDQKSSFLLVVIGESTLHNRGPPRARRPLQVSSKTPTMSLPGISDATSPSSATT